MAYFPFSGLSPLVVHLPAINAYTKYRSRRVSGRSCFYSLGIYKRHGLEHELLQLSYGDVTPP